MKHWPAETPEERGKLAEEKFFEAWSDPQLFPRWVVSVDRPTLHEDLFEKTDAVIVRIHGPLLRIQIKSYQLSESLCRELMSIGVIPMCIFANDSLAYIRQKTHDALKKFALFSKEKPKRNFSSTKKDPRIWYKHGKKYQSY